MSITSLTPKPCRAGFLLLGTPESSTYALASGIRICARIIAASVTLTA